MIDRDHVADLIGPDGYARLEALEEDGYRVVRAGMVPRLDALDEAEQMLVQLSRIGGAIHSPSGTDNAARQIGQLRELALRVLGINRADVDGAE